MNSTSYSGAITKYNNILLFKKKVDVLFPLGLRVRCLLLTNEINFHFNNIILFQCILSSYATINFLFIYWSNFQRYEFFYLTTARMPYSCDPGATSSDIHVHRKQGLLTELLSLSCQVSALLSEVRFS